LRAPGHAVRCVPAPASSARRPAHAGRHAATGGPRRWQGPAFSRIPAPASYCAQASTGRRACRKGQAATRAGPWKVTTHGGHGFAPEFPPVGMPGSAPPPLPRADGHAPRIVGALASSYMWSELMQARALPGLASASLGGGSGAGGSMRCRVACTSRLSHGKHFQPRVVSVARRCGAEADIQGALATDRANGSICVASASGACHGLIWRPLVSSARRSHRELVARRAAARAVRAGASVDFVPARARPWTCAGS